MVELLILFAMFGWLLVVIGEFLASLDAFPTLCAAAVLTPVLAAAGASRALAAMRLDCLRERRAFLPPERFYWPRQSRGLWRIFLAAAVAALVFWAAALALPARLSADPSSLAGWVSGAAAIIATSVAMASLWIFVRGSQRFDRLTPSLVGAARRFMYWLSDNHEFLGEEPERPKAERKRSVY